MTFPIDLNRFQPLVFDPTQPVLTDEQLGQLQANIQVAREAIVFFTAFANTKGLGGHTGGAYDMVPEVLVVDGFMRGNPDIYPVFFDEAGHRVALQYLMAVLHGHMAAEELLRYRQAGAGLYGHPERHDEAGIFFSSGRLGHLWSYVNGVATANPRAALVLFGSDGSQQEGGDAEAARYAVAQALNVNLIIDDNDVTIAGHPTQYMTGFDVAETLAGHGLAVSSGAGEDLPRLYERIHAALTTPGPAAVINKRPMAPGIAGLEGSCKAHDVIAVPLAVDYLKAVGQPQAADMLETAAPPKKPRVYLGSSPEKFKNRDEFGRVLCGLLEQMPDRQERVLVVDSDLEGSCGLHHVRKQFPEVYVSGGIMERNNFSVAAGFGADPGRQGVFGTFAAFMEMVISEISMARLNQANVLAHFSHSGVDDMADNTCHFGINNYFADSGLLEKDRTRLYFPADKLQLQAMLPRIFNDPGLRFVFTTRSATPLILDDAGQPFYDADYVFEPGRDDVIRAGADGYIVTYGEMLYRCLDAVEEMRKRGVNVGLINKATLNVMDPTLLATLADAKFVLVVETQNVKNGLGSRLGTWLLENGQAPIYGRMGAMREGRGGLGEQIDNQGLDGDAIQGRIMTLWAQATKQSQANKQPQADETQGDQSR